MFLHSQTQRGRADDVRMNGAEGARDKQTNATTTTKVALRSRAMPVSRSQVSMGARSQNAAKITRAQGVHVLEDGSRKRPRERQNNENACAQQGGGGKSKLAVSIPQHQGEQKKVFGQVAVKKRSAFEETTNRNKSDTDTKRIKTNKPEAIKPSVKVPIKTTKDQSSKLKPPRRLNKQPTSSSGVCMKNLYDAIEQIPTLPADVANIDADDPQGYHCSMYASDIVNYVQNLELHYSVAQTFLEKYPVKSSSRAVLVDWLIQVQSHLRLGQQSLHLTIAMIDQFLSKTHLQMAKIQLLGITCLLIASKFEERFSPSIEKLLHLTDDSYKFDDVIKMEILVLKVLQFSLSIPTPMVFLDRGLKVIDNEKVKWLSNFLLDLSLPDMKILLFPPSLRAAGAIYLSCRILEKTGHTFGGNHGDAWVKGLEYYLSYSRKDTVLCAQRFARLLDRAKIDKHQGTMEKYAHKMNCGVSKWECLTNGAVQEILGEAAG